MAEGQPAVTAVQIKKELGYDSTAAFAKDWKELPDKDKDDLRKGIGDGTMTY